MDTGFSGVRLDGALEAGCQAGIDLVIPVAADAPAGFAVGGEDFAADGIGGRCGPATGFEVECADFASGVVFDFHDAVVVNGGRTGDDANDGGGDFLPSVEFFAAGQGS